MAEEKTRIHTRISEKTRHKLETAMPNANCQSQNEFVENAICFYSDYIMTREVTNYLAPMLVDALQATVKNSENRIARLMFKETVELSMMMHVLAMGLEVNTDQLDQLRWQCVQEVKKTNGSIIFKETLENNQGEI